MKKLGYPENFIYFEKGFKLKDIFSKPIQIFIFLYVLNSKSDILDLFHNNFYSFIEISNFK